MERSQLVVGRAGLREHWSSVHASLAFSLSVFPSDASSIPSQRYLRNIRRRLDEIFLDLLRLLGVDAWDADQFFDRCATEFA